MIDYPDKRQTGVGIRKPDAADSAAGEEGGDIKEDNEGEEEEIKMRQDDPDVRAAAQLKDVDPSAVRVGDKALEGESE